jgi:hypothetical protein
VAELSFDCLDIAPVPYAVAPTLSVRLRIAETSGVPIDAIALRCQIRILPQRRRYSDEEAERLVDLFGEPPRWADTLKPLQFATVPAMVPRFSGSVEVELPLPCTYDLEVASSRYLHSLADGTVPLVLLFSGTVFGRGPSGALAVDQVSWQSEAEYPMPVAVWRDLMDLYFPGAGWLRLRRDTLDALARYRSTHGLLTWDQTVEALLAQVNEVVR